MISSQLKTVQEVDTEKYDRLQIAINHFKDKFEKLPEYVCRAPGRVNLIGEHIDYCGYSVLPMAVNQDICAAISTNTSGTLNFSNAESCFSDFSSTLKKYTIDGSDPQWYNYVLCGLKGVTECKSLSEPKGMDIMFHGNVPKAAGMSSSSALVCVMGLATAFANDCNMTKYELAEECARCEMYIGTQGGGMDQSISFLAEKGKAKLISFNPLKAEDVKIPDGGIFVVANSCVQLQKAATSHFNIRVAECKIGSQILAKHASIDRKSIKKFSDLQNALGASFDKMLGLVDSALHEEPYTREEICQALEITDEELKNTLLSKNTQNVTTFKLYQRAKHVFSEAQRVHQFKAVCDESSGQEALVKLGNLMNESGFSCSQLYECSCPEVDTLMQLCRDSGALGSRLTGAGWGGCTVSLVPAEKLKEFFSAVKEGYYSHVEESKLKDVLFATCPGDGAAVYTL